MERKTLGCYHDTFLATDVFLLADVFEKFRNACLKKFKLDPAHFYTEPGLAWQALLKTVIENCEHEIRFKDCALCSDEFRLKLLTDIGMLLMIKKGINVVLPRQSNAMLRQTVSIWMTYKILMKRAYIFNNWIQITFADGQWFKSYQHWDLNGRMEKTLPQK